MNYAKQDCKRKSIRLCVQKNRDVILHNLMCSIGGFMGGYAVLCRGNLGSAQTINMMEIIFAIVGKNTYELLLRGIGFVLYILGIALVAILSRKTKINLQRYSIFVNMAGFLVLAAIPEQAKNIAGILPIFFMLSTQWSVFNSVRGYTSATVFSTNNLRQTVLALSEYAFVRDRKHLQTALFYFSTLFWFYINVILSYFAVKFFGVHASLFAFIYAALALAMTWSRDKTPAASSPA